MVWMEEAGLGIRAVAPVVIWSSASLWRLPTPVVDLDLLGRVKERLGDFSPSEQDNDRLQKELAGFLQIFRDGLVDPRSGKSDFAIHVSKYGNMDSIYLMVAHQA